MPMADIRAALKARRDPAALALKARLAVQTLDAECGGAAAQAVGSLHQIGGRGGVGISDNAELRDAAPRPSGGSGLVLAPA
jgi:hypothetical protein